VPLQIAKHPLSDAFAEDFLQLGNVSACKSSKYTMKSMTI